ncbi:hypothetical protein CDAR_536491 [Caerostris darwini]|uniref:Uncharacterized protein n=1 Tax=Caerostris darwini TaxID=1538125 RepID=A0AAV4V1Q2_9ARAC|nr:hypothetical protein CDAR_536491 [Caerostris darwini]
MFIIKIQNQHKLKWKTLTDERICLQESHTKNYLPSDAHGKCIPNCSRTGKVHQKFNIHPSQNGKKNGEQSLGVPYGSGDHGRLISFHDAMAPYLCAPETLLLCAPVFLLNKLPARNLVGS